MKCKFDPTDKPQELGIFICPECGENVVAGLAHPDYELYSNMFVEKTEAIEMNVAHPRMEIWEARNARICLYSDNDKFVCEIRAGIEGETFLSVGYSSPNYAGFDGLTPDVIEAIRKKIDEYWITAKLLDLDEMLPQMYEICKLANLEFNKKFWSAWR